MKTSRILLPALLFAAVAQTALAWVPLGFSFGPDSTGSKPGVLGFPERDGAVYGFRLTLFGGATDTMYGLAVSPLGNGGDGSSQGKDLADGDIAGIAVAGLANVASTAQNGAWQVSGLHNKLGGDGDIIQLCGFFNEIGGNAMGLQVAGIENKAEGDFTGVQIAGILSWAEVSMTGAQAAFVNSANRLRGIQLGAVNYINRDGKGVQLGAINFTDDDFTGIQVGAINIADKLNGLQLGVINYVERDCKGVQIGVFNVVYNATASFIPGLRVSF